MLVFVGKSVRTEIPGKNILWLIYNGYDPQAPVDIVIVCENSCSCTLLRKNIFSVITTYPAN